MPLLEIKNLAIDFVTGAGSARVVDDLDLTLECGRTLGLVGESGSGKSVTALSIANLVPAPPARFSGGEILLEGRDVLKMSARELRGIRGGTVSYVFQEPGASLNPVHRIGAQIAEAIRLHRPEVAHEAEVIRLLERVGIPEAAARITSYPHELSGGTQQRVTIAMALASRPKLLVADEPTTALDVTTQAQIIELLASLRRDLGMAVLLITHNLGIVGDFADAVAVMYAGQIVERGPAQEVLRRPRHPYTRLLIQTVPDLGAESRRLATIPGSVPMLGAFPGGCRFHPRCPQARPECAVVPPAMTVLPGGREVRCPFWNEPVTGVQPAVSG